MANNVEPIGYNMVFIGRYLRYLRAQCSDIDFPINYTVELFNIQDIWLLVKKKAKFYSAAFELVLLLEP